MRFHISPVPRITLPDIRLPKIKLPLWQFPTARGAGIFRFNRKSRLVWYVAGAAVVLAAAFVWYRHRKSRGYFTAGNPRESQPSWHLTYIYPHAYTVETQLDRLTPTKFPTFALNSDEFFVWDSMLPSREFGEALLLRGVTHINALKGKGLSWTVPQGRRFAIIYRDSFQPFTPENLETNKSVVARFVSQFSPGGIDVLCFDLENEQPTAEYATHAQALLAYTRAELGVRYVDFLGMWLVNVDFGVTGTPLSDTFFASYLRGVNTYEDPLPYLQNSWFDTGDWLYSLVHVTERVRQADPALPQVSFWWSRSVDGTMFVPDHVAHAFPLFILFCGGKGLINWFDNKPGVSYSADEALMAGFHRASQHNDIRRGKPEFLTPEISFDGGKTWYPNDALTAKANRHPIVRICRNGSAHVVVGCYSIPGASTVEVMFRCATLTDTIRLEYRKTYLGRA